MKSVLYVGATLMIGASIYGFVDYQKTSHKKEFNNMYKEKEVTEPAKVIDEKTAVVADKKEVTAKEEKVATEKKETKKVAKKKKRKLDTKLFSRGALDERYIKEEKILPEPGKEKKEAVKSENKEQ
jgi:hypothetical protein